MAVQYGDNKHYNTNTTNYRDIYQAKTLVCSTWEQTVDYDGLIETILEFGLSTL